MRLHANMVSADSATRESRDRSTCRGKVVTYAVGGCVNPPGHEDVTRTRIAERIADLLGYEAGGEYDPRCDARAARLYFVPNRTLTRARAEQTLGIEGEADLFGGVVPHEYVATKTITHPLLDEEADAPAGWTHAFGARVADAVLHGYSAFSLADSRRAARLLLQHGDVRIKRACEAGGRGQFVATAMREVNALLADIDPAEIARDGLVLEQNLYAVNTLSVGHVRVGPLRATYYGVQHLTQDHRGAPVYGGSTLLVVRGDYDALLPRVADPGVRTAVEQARRYETAAFACFPGFYASRRNYDIAQGLDAGGRLRSGVLEQSWRIGGASSAEIGALEALAADPRLHAVRAASTEVYGARKVPPDATVYYDGDDPQVGRITKYAVVQRL